MPIPQMISSNVLHCMSKNQHTPIRKPAEGFNTSNHSKIKTFSQSILKNISKNQNVKRAVQLPVTSSKSSSPQGAKPSINT